MFLNAMISSMPKVFLPAGAAAGAGAWVVAGACGAAACSMRAAGPKIGRAVTSATAKNSLKRVDFIGFLSNRVDRRGNGNSGKLLFYPTRDNKYAAGPVSVNTAVCRSEQQVDRSVAVGVPDPHRVEAQRIAGDATGDGPQQTAVLARVEIDTSAGERRRCILPGANGKIGVAVAIDVSGVRRTGTESFACACAGQRE